MDTVGAVASIVGVVIAIVGFAITIWGVMRSKTAAQQAREAAVKVREDMSRVGAIEQFASALTSMEEIKRLQRQGAWELLLERYPALRKSLISIREAYPQISEQHRVALQKAILYFARIEDGVEVSLRDGGEPPDVAKLNSVVSKQIDQLQAVLIEIRNQIGR